MTKLMRASFAVMVLCFVAIFLVNLRPNDYSGDGMSFKQRLFQSKEDEDMRVPLATDMSPSEFDAALRKFKRKLEQEEIFRDELKRRKDYGGHHAWLWNEFSLE